MKAIPFCQQDLALVESAGMRKSPFGSLRQDVVTVREMLRSRGSPWVHVAAHSVGILRELAVVLCVMGIIGAAYRIQLVDLRSPRQNEGSGSVDESVGTSHVQWGAALLERQRIE